ncbi:MAG: N-acetyltransferase, partial [Firmicutes bacterium]|nr:N-acetyltransferase [Bacillota bacterium]
GKEADQQIDSPREHAAGAEAPVLRRARIPDVEEMLELINTYARQGLMLPRGPKYLYETIRDFVVAEHTAAGGRRRIVACGSLSVLWKDIAEVRSLAVHPEFRRRGLGARILCRLIEDARELGIKRVYAFAKEVGFFTKFGFTPMPREELPSKLWGECSCCPKYYECDETGLVLEL